MLQEKEALELIPLWALVAKVSGEVPVCTIVFLTGSLILLIDIFGNHVAFTSKQCFCRQAFIYMDGKWKCFTCQLGSPSKEDKRWLLCFCQLHKMQ